MKKNTHAISQRPAPAEPLPPGLLYGRGELFEEIDVHFARFIARFGGDGRVALAAAHLSRALGQAHTCLDLSAAPEGADPRSWPSLEEWRETLGASRAVAAPDAPKPTPLVLDASGRLYTRRFFEEEAGLAAALLARAPKEATAGPAEGQTAAAKRAASNRLTIISGGPGTGKTTTTVHILLKMMPLGRPPLRFALAAPTGKAAARLEEAVREGLSRAARPDLLAALPRASTLHRLLGSTGGHGFRRNAESPLALDLLIVDEASMMPLPLAASLFDALPAAARVIFLGDRDQLASVDPGAVLADIVDAASEPGSPLAGTLAVLKKNYRFGDAHPIHRLAQAVREGRSGDAARLLSEPGEEGLDYTPLPPPGALSAALRGALIEGFGPALREPDPARALEALGRFRILCAVRQGPYGVEELNRRVAALLREAGLLRGAAQPAAGTPWLITHNDPQLGLFNGDIGLVLPDPAQPGGPLWAWFPGDGGETSAPPRRFAPAQLPMGEPAFAMTVHKAQGSEFDRVLFILPERDTPILTRELIYTGLTRARSHVTLWSPPSLFETGVKRNIRRASGLRDRLACHAAAAPLA